MSSNRKTTECNQLQTSSRVYRVSTSPAWLLFFAYTRNTRKCPPPRPLVLLSCSCSLAFLWPRIDILPRLCRKLAQAPQQEIEKERESPSTPVSQSTRVSCARVRSLSLLLLLLLYDFFMLNALRIPAGIKRGIKCPPRHPNRDQIEYQIDLVPLVIWDCHSPRLWIADAQFRIVCVYLAKG